MRLGGCFRGLVGWLVWLLAGPGWAGEGARGMRGAVATVHPAATRAGLEALQAGGNAVDAAIACALTLGVVDGHNSGIGGGCFFLIRLADGRVVALDGRETAPRRATREMFLRDGRADPALSQDGPLAAGVPGELAVLARASTNHGRLPLARLLEQAASLAERGFTLGPGYVARVGESRDALRRFPAAAGLLLTPQGDPLPAGTLLRQPDLAATYRALARHGWAWFYDGEFARRTGDWMAANGGLLRREDFADYRPRERPPVRGRYRGCDIISFPPPSSGGVHVVEILNLLERFRLRPLGDDSAEFVHLVAEAMKLAFADRAHWLGDPDFARVPRGLVDKKYAAGLARRISRER
ncbi:MAG: gamma-glutamyltransferase family protein, partial [Verrucomicrobiota bacterium]